MEIQHFWTWLVDFQMSQFGLEDFRLSPFWHWIKPQYSFTEFKNNLRSKSPLIILIIQLKYSKYSNYSNYSHSHYSNLRSRFSQNCCPSLLEWFVTRRLDQLQIFSPSAVSDGLVPAPPNGLSGLSQASARSCTRAGACPTRAGPRGDMQGHCITVATPGDVTRDVIIVCRRSRHQ